MMLFAKGEKSNITIQRATTRTPDKNIKQFVMDEQCPVTLNYLIFFYSSHKSAFYILDKFI